MDAVHNETDNTSRQSRNNCLKTPTTENEYCKFENIQP